MPHTSLNPKLQQALSCLDLRLEDELTRYRRQKAGLSVAPIVMRPKPPKQSIERTQTPDSDAPPKAISFDLGKPAMPEMNAIDDESALIPYEPETAGDALFEMANEGETTPPDDYLESSEHLLRSLEREEAKVEVERGFLQSLSTPLGIGSMLTLLVSSAMLGYVIMNPSILSGIAQRVAQPEVAQTPAGEVTNADIPNSPPLDRDEFSDLGLDTLSVVRTKPAPVAVAPAPSPSPTASPAAPTAIMPPTAAPSIAPSAIAGSSVLLPSVTVPRTPTPAAPAQTPASSLQPSRYYRVEIPFTGDQSLATARQIVPDAFVRSDGKIQLAATRTESEAQQKAQELKNRGLAAAVQKP